MWNAKAAGMAKNALDPAHSPNKPVLPVAVVVSGRNYARFLGDALESVHRQLPGAAEVVYVDNGSTDDSVAVARAQGVDTVRMRRCNTVGPCRNAGAKRTTAPYLVFLDADDVLPEGYLKVLHDAIESDGRAAVAYPRHKTFGIRNNDGDFCDPYSHDALLRTNYIVSCSMMKRAALEAVGGWDVDLPCYQDWDLWLRIAAQGWQMTAAPSVCVDVRTHPDSLTSMTMTRAKWYQAIMQRQPVTVFVPFGPGRPIRGKRFFDVLRDGGLNWAQTTVVFYDNAHDRKVSKMLRDYLGKCPARGTAYYKDDTLVTYHDIKSRVGVMPERMAEIWTHGSQFFHGDFIISIEEDTVPACRGAYARLYEGMAPDVDAVTGIYHSRPVVDSNTLLVREWFVRDDGALSIRPISRYPGGLPTPPQDGCTDIGASGVGCMLLRKETLRGLTFPVGRPRNWLGQDFGLCRHIAERGRRLLAHWGVRCRHYYSAQGYT